jgi:hypothetical protein
MNGDLKQTFVLQCVQDYLREAQAAMEVSIIRKRALNTEALLKSIANRARVNGAGATGELLFKEHGRFIDMGTSRGHPLGGLKATKINLASKNKSGFVFVKDKTRKPKKIYAAVVYGKLNYLTSKLMYGYTDAVIASLKQMENASTITTN